MTRSRRLPLIALSIAAVLAGCGGSSSSKPASSGQAPPGASSIEARSAATGDIPDNQNFLTYKGAGFSISYPEGWAQTGGGGDVSFRDKNNVVHVALRSGPRASGAGVGGKPQQIALKGGQAIKVRYTTVSKPNPVTGKRVKLMVDRYVLARAGKVATLDLGTPVGVDNVDAYRLMAESFRWR
ncbi:MAG: hypothetical protein QOC86_557 [Gaiellales bacterium]|nr:hypothetical protein [Gaiellales bacterium]